MARITAEVVSIGDEMTSGARIDTNAQWLSRRIGELGIEVTFHSTVGDSLQDNIDVFRTAAGRVDFVVSTGGLGPTQDDLTRFAIAKAAGVALIEDASSLEHITRLFADRGRTMPDRNKIQALIPIGGRAIFNPQGTAPGVDMVVPVAGGQSARVFALPGVPAEMKRMFDDTVAPAVVDQSGAGQCIRHSVMRFFGTGESDMEERLGDMIARDRQPRVGITVSAATISLRIAAMAASVEQADAMIAATRREIMERVREFYFGDGDGYEQHHAIEQTLRRRGECVVVIELGHAAPLADCFASLAVPEDADKPAYAGGLSFTEAGAMTRILGAVDTSAAVAEVMTRYQADWAIVVDGYPRLADGSTTDAATPFSVRVFRDGRELLCREKSLGGHPSILHQRIGKTALHWFRSVLET